MPARSSGSPRRTSGRRGRPPAASFVTFALGAFIPLAPWLFTSGTVAIVLSVVLGALAALVVGVVLARSPSGPCVVSALRQLAVTASRPRVTFGVGQGDRHGRELTVRPASAGSRR